MPTDGDQNEPRLVDGIDNETEQHRQMLNIATQETRFVLIQNILSHPEKLPTLAELDYLNPSKSKTTIHEHLTTLIEHDIVEERTLPKSERQRDLPWQFYGLTDTGYELLEQAGVLSAEQTLREIFEMVEKTEKIERYIDAPRPT